MVLSFLSRACGERSDKRSVQRNKRRALIKFISGGVSFGAPLAGGTPPEINFPFGVWGHSSQEKVRQLLRYQTQRKMVAL